MYKSCTPLTVLPIFGAKHAPQQILPNSVWQHSYRLAVLSSTDRPHLTSNLLIGAPFSLIPHSLCPNPTMPSISVSLPLKPMSSLSSFFSSLSLLPHTVRDTEVPLLFREPYILSGYRPVGHSWSFYFLSLFQIHNETINVWSHLLAGVCVALRFSVFALMCGGVLQYFLCNSVCVRIRFRCIFYVCICMCVFVSKIMPHNYCRFKPCI